jgi:diguanylate cyclase (GGDEF)-like protein/PAS domain S-box-containing protein
VSGGKELESSTRAATSGDSVTLGAARRLPGRAADRRKLGPGLVDGGTDGGWLLAKGELERRVELRTSELSEANRLLEQEIAERRRAEEGLRYALLRLQQHITHTPLAVVELHYLPDDPEQGRIAVWSGQAEPIFGWNENEALGRTFDDLGLIFQGDQPKRLLSRGDLLHGRKQSLSVNMRLYGRDGGVRHCRIYASVVHGLADRPPTVLLLIEDMTERVLAEEHVYRLAHHDPLTELPNRLLFKDRLERAIAHAKRAGQKLALMLLDLDHFKEVNDSLGHPAGDQLLREVALRLRQLARETDTWARLGGDEFALVQTGLNDPQGAHLVAERVVEALSEPFSIDGQLVDGSGSLGVTIFPDDGTTPERLMRNADMALYRAKGAGRRCFDFYRPDMDAEIQVSRSLQRRLRQALDQGELELHYQPMIELATGRLMQVEALARLEHPEGGQIAPAAFIPIAEASGMIQPLGRWVIERACRDAARWAGAGQPLKVAVNVSPAQLRQSEFVGELERLLRQTDVEPTLLEFELTENVFLDPSRDLIVGTLQSITDLGISLALDDFGTGYSSLAYLRHVRFDKLKIDGSFIRAIGRDQDGEAIVRAIVALAHSLGMQVVAEWVETEEQREFLQAEGCDFAQGYLLSHPAPVPACPDFPGLARL